MSPSNESHDVGNELAGARRDEMPAANLVRCRRVGAMVSPEEHTTCPYCFGRAAEVSTADYARFCDFKAGEDPICFGYPTDCGRFGR